MIIGIISDTHGKISMTKKALDLFKSLGVESIIHCGDTCSLKIFKEFCKWKIFYFVWGNADKFERNLIPEATSYLKKRNVHVPTEVPLVITLGGRSILVYHGHERRIIRIHRKGKAKGHSIARALSEQSYIDTGKKIKYIMTGHTHKHRIKKKYGIQFLNPGSVSQPREPGIISTVATLDTKKDQVVFYAIKDGQNEYSITD